MKALVSLFSYEKKALGKMCLMAQSLFSYALQGASEKKALGKKAVLLHCKSLFFCCKKALGKGSAVALLARVEALKKDRNVKGLVGKRLREFKALGKKGSNELYKELCFCTLTANFDAAKSIVIQEKVCNGFIKLPEKKLEQRLRSLGYRYPNRAAYICDSRRHLGQLKQMISSFNDETALRQWLVENVKGLGFKEASHFMRNIGFENVAIIDFHIVDLLVKEKLIEKPKTMTKKRYLEIEKTLAWLAAGLGISLAELDLYLWFLETGKILK